MTDDADLDEFVQELVEGVGELDINDLDDEHVQQAMTEREAGIERARRDEHPVLPADRADVLTELTEREQIILLGMTMHSLRGNWTTIEEREALVHWLCDAITDLPDAYLGRVKWNAYLCNGHLIDGRIFRDGDRRNGMHGNLAAIVVGDDRTDEDWWRGTYKELWEMGYEPDEAEKERLSSYIPNDLTYTASHETCVFKEDPPVEEDVPWERPRWTEICNTGTYDARVPRILCGMDGDDEEATLPFGVRHVLRPNGNDPVEVVLL